uniref:Peptidase M15 n=1 Tax=Pseudomonas phage HRDY3 TaxID=3236930 RepID=A0AB39CDU3_9VIRU
MQISEHYTDLDVGFDLLAHKSKIDNTPPRDALLAAEKVAKNILEPLRSQFDFRIASWYRSSALEREYCKGSYYDWLRENGLPFNETNWVKYLDGKQHILGCAVSLISNEAQAIFEHLQQQTFDILQMRGPYIHVSYVEGANRKIVLS